MMPVLIFVFISAKISRFLPYSLMLYFLCDRLALSAEGIVIVDPKRGEGD